MVVSESEREKERGKKRRRRGRKKEKSGRGRKKTFVPLFQLLLKVFHAIFFFFLAVLDFRMAKEITCGK